MGGKYTELRCLAVAEAIERLPSPLTPIDPVAVTAFRSGHRN
jgi:hypothetical protein